jgi:guanine nucleotide-binding protein G(I)/G(S)/G(T) subunit beta-1
MSTDPSTLKDQVKQQRKLKKLPTSDEVDFEDPDVHAHNQLRAATKSKASSEQTPPSPEKFQMRKKLMGHFGKVYSLHWSGDSRRLVSASQDGKMIVWDGLTTNKLWAIPLRSAWVMTCAFDQSTETARTVACGGLDNMCSVYVLNDTWTSERGPSAELSGHEGYLSCCRFISDRQILTSSGDHTCMLWDIPTRKSVAVFTGHTSDVMSVSVSKTNKAQFVSGSCDMVAKVWDTRLHPSTPTMELWGHEADINCVEFFNDGHTIATGSDDASVRVWDLRCGRELAKFVDEGVISGITSVSSSFSGRLLFAAQDDFNCSVWDTLSPGKSPKRLGSGSFLRTHENRVSCVNVSPNGDAVCTGSWDTSMKIWA